MSGGTFAALDNARATVLAQGARFAEELAPILRQSLRSGFERLCIDQAGLVTAMDPAARAAMHTRVERAIQTGVDRVLERLRSPEVWLAPHTAPELTVVKSEGWPTWVPEWIARMVDRRGPGPATLGPLDDPTNRIWVALLAAPGPLDDLLEELGFRPGRPRAGGRFGVGARTASQLDPSGGLRGPWKRYRTAYERLAALTQDPRSG